MLADYVPWYVWMLLSFLGIGGGTAALIFFVPAALPFLIGLWNRAPLWVKVLLVGITGGFFAYLAGRNAGRSNAEERQRKLDDSARTNATEVQNEVNSLTPSEIDRELQKNDDVWPDDPPRQRRR